MGSSYWTWSRTKNVFLIRAMFFERWCNIELPRLREAFLLDMLCALKRHGFDSWAGHPGHGHGMWLRCQRRCCLFVPTRSPQFELVILWWWNRFSEASIAATSESCGIQHIWKTPFATVSCYLQKIGHYLMWWAVIRRCGSCVICSRG